MKPKIQKLGYNGDIQKDIDRLMKFLSDNKPVKAYDMCHILRGGVFLGTEELKRRGDLDERRL